MVFHDFRDTWGLEPQPASLHTIFAHRSALVKTHVTKLKPLNDTVTSDQNSYSVKPVKQNNSDMGSKKIDTFEKDVSLPFNNKF